MAATKKTTAKTTVSKPVEETIVETVEETVEKETKVPVKPVVTKKTFTDSDYILCRSIWSGGLNVSSISGNVYEFKDYDAECEINYRDLVTMIRRGSSHVFTPRFVILDEDFLADFPTVQRVYKSMYTRKDLIDILDLPVSKMEKEIAKLPDATKNSMLNLVATQIANGHLDSISKVRKLSEIFDSDFNLLSDLFVQR